MSEGLIRIDVDESGTTTLSIYEGVAELASEGGSALVRSGQRSLGQSGRRPEPSYEFNTARWDEFSSWSDGRDQLYRRTTRVRGVPEEVAVYAGELDHYGTWRYDNSYGHVWYPRVLVGWSPYHQGTMGVHSVWLDVGVLRTLGLGALPLRSLGVMVLTAGTGSRGHIGDRRGSPGHSDLPG